MANPINELESGIKSIRGFFSRKVNSAEDVNDLVQVTFEKTLQKAKEQHLDNPVSYAHQVAKTVVIDFWRSRKSHEIYSEDVIESEFPTPEQSSYSQAKVECMKSVLQNMPELRRNVFLKKRLEGLSRAEIAASLNISEDAVKKHITRAMIDLKKGMEERGW